VDYPLFSWVVVIHSLHVSSFREAHHQEIIFPVQSASGIVYTSDSLEWTQSAHQDCSVFSGVRNVGQILHRETKENNLDVHFEVTPENLKYTLYQRLTVQEKWSPDDELPESSKHVENEWRLAMKIKDSPQVTSCWLFFKQLQWCTEQWM